MALLCRDKDIIREMSTNNNVSDPLAIIYNEGFWRLNKVSPLYKMCYSPVRLKMYASKVKRNIVSSVQGSSAKYSVKFEELPNLKYCNEDASGLMVTVSTTTENSVLKVVYVAVLLSWGQYDKIDETVHLPYMLERGEQKVATAVRESIHTLFDCSIDQYSFTQPQLLQFGFNFVDCTTPRLNDRFIIKYKTPRVEHKDKISLEFDIEDIHNVWQGLKRQGMKQSDAVSFTYHILQNQIFHMMGLDITILEVIEITLPKAEVRGKGVVKMKTPETVNSVFTVLNDICDFNYSPGIGPESSL